MNTLKIFLVVCLSFLIHACGFHLRQNVSLPPELQQVYVNSTDHGSPVTEILMDYLSDAHVTIMPDAHHAPYTILITHDALTKHIAGVSSNTQLRQYRLTYTVIYEILDPAGHVLVPPTQIRSLRNITVNTNQMLGSIHEEETFANEMRHDVVRRLVSKLNSAETLSKLKA